MYPSAIEKIVKLFSKFPTIGPRTATRFALYLFDLPEKDIKELVDALNEIKKINTCNLCYRSTEGEICSICSNKSRDHSTLCVVERETDLESIEKTKEYNGVYFVLGGTVSPLRKEDFRKVRSKQLKDRVEKDIKEVIIATNNNTEGEATALYIHRVLKDKPIKISRLGRGLPTGGELEYADPETLKSALTRRN